MGRSLTAAQAAEHLGIRVQTLYAYVSRGQLARTLAPDGRRSLFDLDDVEVFAGRRRTRRVATRRRAGLAVEIDTGITRMGEHELVYRDHSAVELARTASFETVAELLWGVGPLGPAAWRPTSVPAARAAARAATTRATVHDRLIMMVTRLGAMDPDRADPTPHAVAHRAAGAIATLAAANAPDDARIEAGASVTDAVLAALAFEHPDRFRPALQRSLILLADHELASSTLAVRVAASVRSDPYACLATGLGVLTGPLHGGAAADVRRFLAECERNGASSATSALLTEGRPVPGWGHKIYRDDDPRWRPIVDAIPDHRTTRARLALMDEATAIVGSRLRVRPNVDWATGTLAFVADLEPHAIELVMALSRMAGWIAHAIEEYEAPPVRFRGVTRYVPSRRPPVPRPM